MAVAADGSVVVVQTLPTNSSDVSVKVGLLSPIISYMVVVDQDGSPLQYQVSGSNVTVYTLGATEIKLQYYTEALTNKQGAVWSMNFSAPYNATIVLPPNATIISVSGTPVSLSEQNGSPVVVVVAGNWEVDYRVPISTQNSASSSGASSTGTSTSSSTTGGPGSGEGFPYVYILAGAVAAAVVAILLLLRKRRSTIDIGGADLRPDDIQVLNYISEKGGKVFEPEIRTRFVLPKTSAWRQIKRLERLGYVRITKVGSQNQIELVKNREKPT
jgi:uncharacterized membrane protein